MTEQTNTHPVTVGILVDRSRLTPALRYWVGPFADIRTAIEICYANGWSSSSIDHVKPNSVTAQAYGIEVPLQPHRDGLPNLRILITQAAAQIPKATGADLTAALSVALCRLYCDRSITPGAIAEAVRLWLDARRSAPALV